MNFDTPTVKRPNFGASIKILNNREPSSDSLTIVGIVDRPHLIIRKIADFISFASLRVRNSK